MEKETKKISQPVRTNKCVTGVCNPERTQGLKAPAPKGEHILVNLKGPGVFLGAQITKQGGSSGLTFISLDIDGRNLANLSYAAAQNWGLTQPNPYGIVILGSGEIKTLTIGFPLALRFKTKLTLTAIVNESGIAQILANIIHGKE